MLSWSISHASTYCWRSTALLSFLDIRTHFNRHFTACDYGSPRSLLCGAAAYMRDGLSAWEGHTCLCRRRRSCASSCPSTVSNTMCLRCYSHTKLSKLSPMYHTRIVFSHHTRVNIDSCMPAPEIGLTFFCTQHRLALKTYRSQIIPELTFEYFWYNLQS